MKFLISYLVIKRAQSTSNYSTLVVSDSLMMTSSRHLFFLRFFRLNNQELGNFRTRAKGIIIFLGDLETSSLRQRCPFSRQITMTLFHFNLFKMFLPINRFRSVNEKNSVFVLFLSVNLKMNNELYFFNPRNFDQSVGKLE